MTDELRVARVAAEAALATDGVDSLNAGPMPEIATYGPGEKVVGVIVTEDEVELHIVASYPLESPIPELNTKIREKVAPKAEGRAVTIAVDDLRAADDEDL